MNNSRISEAARSAVAGVVFGLLFPAIAVVVEATSIRLNNPEFDNVEVIDALLASPLVWMIASAPVFLGLVAWLAGARKDAAIQLLADREEVIKHQTADLRRARDEALAADSAKSEFLANMSHEIRTPMNGVIGMADILLGSGLNEQQTDFAMVLKNSGESLLVILNDILDFSKIEAGRMTLEAEPFDLNECIQSGLELMGSRAAEKGLELIVSADPMLQHLIRGDVTRVRQIVMNLVGNAIKFTEEGEIVVTTRVESAAGDTARIRVSVADTGIGISPHGLTKLFKSFSQVDASTTRKFGGTGLGLAISKSLAELMGGHVEVTSPGEGKGSTFSFTIEAALGDEIPELAEGGDGDSLVGRRVLIVDDNLTNRRILDVETRRWGMIPVLAPSASVALQAYRRDPNFDVAILDMQMPDMDGAELAQLLHVHFRQRGRSFPLMLLSSGLLIDDQNRLLFSAAMNKPVRASRMRSTLVSLVEKQGAAAGSRDLGVETDKVSLAETCPLRILVAEDNLVNQKVISAMLDRLGYDPEVVANGAEAIERVCAGEDREPIDVILMDMQMPLMGGVDATLEIRRLDGIAQPRIVALTANASTTDREACIDAGMDDYVSKPIKLEVLANALKAASAAGPYAGKGGSAPSGSSTSKVLRVIETSV